MTDLERAAYAFIEAAEDYVRENAPRGDGSSKWVDVGDGCTDFVTWLPMPERPATH